jgi:hypothetical protein
MSKDSSVIRQMRQESKRVQAELAERTAQVEEAEAKLRQQEYEHNLSRVVQVFEAHGKPRTAAELYVREMAREVQPVNPETLSRWMQEFYGDEAE